MQNKFLCTALSLSGSFAHQSPPEGVGETPEHFVLVLLDEVDEERGEDEPEEANVDGRDQLLWQQGRFTFRTWFLSSLGF